MNYKKEILAGQYAYGMCGSSHCEDCNEFCHITTEEEKLNLSNVLMSHNVKR